MVTKADVTLLGSSLAVLDPCSRESVEAGSMFYAFARSCKPSDRKGLASAGRPALDRGPRTKACWFKMLLGMTWMILGHAEMNLLADTNRAV